MRYHKIDSLMCHMSDIKSGMKNTLCMTTHLLPIRTLYHTKYTVLHHIVNIQLDKLLNTKHKHFLLPNACLLHNSYNKLLTLCMSDSSSHMVLQYRLQLHRILTLVHKHCLRVLCSDWRNKMCSYWQ